MLRKAIILFIAAFLPGFLIECNSQNPSHGPDDNKKKGDCRIMFYNVENLFDTTDDPKTNDNEFLPDSKLHWTDQRFRNKINNIFKAIAAAGQPEPPEIIGFAEVENRYVLQQLVSNTPLLKYKYDSVHQDSPDQRGIDVALIFRPDNIKMISYKYFRINYSSELVYPTRDILYVKFRLNRKDTLHFFVNHWPSRSGGQLASEKHRIFVASVLRSKTDSLFAENKNSKIIIIGDFNDEPENKSIKVILGAEKKGSDLIPGHLYNISSSGLNKSVPGTHKYEGNWAILDQIIVSSSMLSNNGIHTNTDSYTIFNPPFLLENDEKYLGFKPFRTYAGFKYLGGFSDHLPVYLDLYLSR